MRQDAVQLEEQRLNANGIDTQPPLHERHRAFPAVFENRQHKRILDVAAGVGYVAQRIRDQYPAEMVCNDISPTCLSHLRSLNLPTLSFSLDREGECFPIQDGEFDAVIALATIEHLINIDKFVSEVTRILAPEGCFYISAPNYASLLYLMPVLMKGRTFHNPMNPEDRYEFYAHVRYFTYRTMIEYVSSFGLKPEAVYLPVPRDSSRYQSMLQKSKLRAMVFKWTLAGFYRLSPRWASEPIICFRKTQREIKSIRKVIL